MSAKFKLLQISDTHLSRTHAYFHDNWLTLLDAIQTSGADLLVHSGDVSFNGPARADDLVFAREEMNKIGLPWHALAGNHDIGEAPPFSRLQQPLTDERINAWRENFGDLWWSFDKGDWRFIGLDTALTGSGLALEGEQFAFLEKSLRERGSLEAMVFMHMPPFSGNPDSQAFTTSCVPFPARKPFLDLCVETGVRIVSCGHLHVYNTLRYNGIDIVWAPTTAMISVQKQLGAYGKVPKPGFLEWMFDGRAASHRFVQPELMFMLDVTSWTDGHGQTTTGMPPRPLRQP